MLLFLSLIACRVELGPPGATSREGRPTVWVYTAIYQNQLDQFAAVLAEDLPDIDVQFFQGGSEKVAQRWEAEHAAGASPACVIATSDPAWYVDLTRRGLLHPYVSPRALELPREWVTPTFASHRVDLMVLGVHNGDEGPRSFAELTDPRWKDQFSTGDPFSSGTTFTTVSAFDQVYGDEFLERLDENGWVMGGGNSAVLSRIESAEKPVGVVLLNNLLQKPGVAQIVYPEDGAVPIPGPLAIPTDCREIEAAEEVVDWFMGAHAEALVIKNQMHSPFPGAAAPEGAPPLDQIKLFPLPEGFTDAVADRAPSLRAFVEGLQK